ncbi:MAG: hypothetical protein V2B20_04345 [Pseudomonadota bacterium]
MKPGDIHADFQPENAPDRPVIFMLSCQLAKGISPLSEETLASGCDNGYSAVLASKERMSAFIAMTGLRDFWASIKIKASASGLDNASPADFGFIRKPLRSKADTASAGGLGLDNNLGFELR